jgi:hypothetical protein
MLDRQVRSTRVTPSLASDPRTSGERAGNGRCRIDRHAPAKGSGSEGSHSHGDRYHRFRPRRPWPRDRVDHRQCAPRGTVHTERVRCRRPLRRDFGPDDDAGRADEDCRSQHRRDCAAARPCTSTRPAPFRALLIDRGLWQCRQDGDHRGHAAAANVRLRREQSRR